MTHIEKIENLHWKFPNDRTLKPLRKYRDYELNQIRNIVRNNKTATSNWFAIPAKQWFEDITELLKYRKVSREVKLTLQKN